MDDLPLLANAKMPLLSGPEIPPYQQKLIEFLDGFKDARGLQDIARRYRFTKEEAARYREFWGKWLEPKGSKKEAHHARSLG